jgi:type III restriction enzyme
VKNAGLGFGIPYLHNGQVHEYVPDFLIQLEDRPSMTMILETKGFDPLAEIKQSAAQRWVCAVNAESRMNPASHRGEWQYVMVRRIGDISSALAGVVGVARPVSRL